MKTDDAYYSPNELSFITRPSTVPSFTFQIRNRFEGSRDEF
jgi:hypothetical protein